MTIKIWISPDKTACCDGLRLNSSGSADNLNASTLVLNTLYPCIISEHLTWKNKHTKTQHLKITYNTILTMASTAVYNLFITKPFCYVTVVHCNSITWQQFAVIQLHEEEKIGSVGVLRFFEICAQGFSGGYVIWPETKTGIVSIWVWLAWTIVVLGIAWSGWKV